MSIIKRLDLLCLVAVIVLMATGCQSTPETAVVTSKSDGAFEAALETDADVQTETENSQVSPATYTDSFTNTDGDISFQVELDVPVITADTPVLRVRPKTISSECAKQVAEVLFAFTNKGIALSTGISKEGETVMCTASILAFWSTPPKKSLFTPFFNATVLLEVSCCKLGSKATVLISPSLKAALLAVAENIISAPSCGALKAHFTMLWLFAATVTFCAGYSRTRHAPAFSEQS